MKKIVLLLSVLTLHAMTALPSLAESTPNAHAPIGVMGDHIHKQGEWMLGYRYMYMEMKDHGGQSPVDSHDHSAHTHRQSPLAHTVLGGEHDEHSPAAPASHVHEMNMQMHMLELMYAPSDIATLMLMAPYNVNEMTHNEEHPFTTRSEGFGDLSLSGLFGVYQQLGHQVILNLGLSLPTGSISDTNTYHGTESRHPYHMRLGSGTYDFLPGVTYTGRDERLSWGTQLGMVIRLGENDNYSLGDRYRLTGWTGYQLNNWLSSSVRLTGEVWEDVEGEDEAITFSNAFSNPDEQAGQLLELGVGLNVLIPEGMLKGHRFGIELNTPLDQSVNDGVHEIDWTLTVGWQVGWS